MAVMLMGTAEEVPDVPMEQVKFLEDLTPEELGIISNAKIPSGLQNLGNTCYFNSVLQSFRALPGLEKAISAGQVNNAGSGEARLALSIGKVFGELSKAGGAPLTPYSLVNQLYEVFPDFGEKKEGSMVPMQQDAEECFSRIVSIMDRQIAGGNNGRSLIAGLLGGEMAVEYKNVETEAEDPSRTTENFFKLSCHIKKDTSHLLTGLTESLQEHVTKNSVVLGREAVYEKKQRIARLPKYLAVQLVRFYWKAGVGDKAGNRAKVVKPVDFPEKLDTFELCAPELQEKLKPRRKDVEEYEDEKLGLAKDSKGKEKEGEEKVGEETKGEEKGKKETGPEKGEASGSRNPDLENDTGRYELQAIITHEGYSAEGGHYVAWTKDPESKDNGWLLFDDDKVSRVKWETVKALAKSTGDAHIPYLLIYSTIEYDAPYRNSEENGKREEGEKKDVEMAEAK